MRNIIAILLFAGLLTACASTPSETDFANADYGDYPENYQEIVITYLNAVLKDPESAKIEWHRKPYKGYFGAYGKFTFGYITCARVNARNSFGGYTGGSLDSFLIKNGRVVEGRLGTTGGDSIWDYFNQSVCS